MVTSTELTPPGHFCVAMAQHCMKIHKHTLTVRPLHESRCSEEMPKDAERGDIDAWTNWYCWRRWSCALFWRWSKLAHIVHGHAKHANELSWHEERQTYLTVTKVAPRLAHHISYLVHGDVGFLAFPEPALMLVTNWKNIDSLHIHLRCFKVVCKVLELEKSKEYLSKNYFIL